MICFFLDVAAVVVDVDVVVDDNDNDHCDDHLEWA